MVGKTGFEPATPWSQTKCSTKLSHFPIKMVRSKGFEPLTFWFVAKHSIQLSYERMTRYRSIISNNMVAPAGIEPATRGFSVLCSTDWATEPHGGLDGTWTRDLLRDRQTWWTTTLRNQWLREMDLNQRPLGYEPNELPSCSIPRYKI